MTQLVLYTLAATALGVSYTKGWPAALLGIAALAAGVAVHAIEARRADLLLHLRADVTQAKDEAARALSDITKLRGEVHAAQQRRPML